MGVTRYLIAIWICTSLMTYDPEHLFTCLLEAQATYCLILFIERVQKRPIQRQKVDEWLQGGRGVTVDGDRISFRGGKNVWK